MKIKNYACYFAFSHTGWEFLLHSLPESAFSHTGYVEIVSPPAHWKFQLLLHSPSGCAFSFFIFVSYDIVYVRTSGFLKRILTSGFASTEHFSKRSVPSTEWVTMQDGGKRTDKVIVVSSVP